MANLKNICQKTSQVGKIKKLSSNTKESDREIEILKKKKNKKKQRRKKNKYFIQIKNLDGSKYEKIFILFFLSLFFILFEGFPSIPRIPISNGV